jgi:hypothetical protein
MNNKMYKKGISHRYGAAKLLALLAATLFSMGSMAQNSVGITFDANGCPQPGVADVGGGQGQMITWQAVDQEGNDSTESFELFFDPIQGGPLRAPQGTLRRPVDSRAPAGLYKYTVVGSRCPASPLDPNFRVY